MTTPRYRAPWFLALSRISKGTAWTLHTSALDVLRDQGASELSEDCLALALACLPQRARALALRALLAVGLWVRTPGGYQLHQEPAAEVTLELPPAPRSGAERTRAWREKRTGRDVTRDASPPASQPTSQGTSQPASPVASHDVTAGKIPGDPRVIGPVTPACAPARAKENSPSSPLSPEFEKEEGEGEREISPLPPSATRALSPAGVTGTLGADVSAVLAGLPGAPSSARSPETLEERFAAVVALWAKTSGVEASELAGCDHDPIWARLNGGSRLEEFRAAFAHATSDAWFLEGDRRHWPRLVCGSKWAECVRKGKLKLGSSAPPSSRRLEAPPPPPSSPRPEPPETLPFGGPYASPTRIRDHLGARYQPIPEERIYLRMDLYLARLAQRGSGQEAAE